MRLGCGHARGCGSLAGRRRRLAGESPPTEAQLRGCGPRVVRDLARGEELLGRLPTRRSAATPSTEVAAELKAALDAERIRLPARPRRGRLRALTDDSGARCATRISSTPRPSSFPGLAPTREQMAAERELALPDKDGLELAQGLFFSFVLASPRCGAHLVWAMLRPTAGGARAARRLPRDGRRRPRRHVPRAARAGRLPRDPERRVPERRGLAHAADDRGRGRPGAARPRGGDRRDPRRGRLAPALCGAAGVRRRA